MDAKPTLYLIDDDPATTSFLCDTLKPAKISLATFASSKDFFAQVPDPFGCLLLQIAPGNEALENMQKMKDQQIALPVILLAAKPPVALVVQGMKAGAVDFLELPLEPKTALALIRQNLALAEKFHTLQEERKKVAEKVAKLTAREKQIMQLLASGMKNKAIAEELGISRRTQDIHRGKILNKTKARTVADLANWVHLLET